MDNFVRKQLEELGLEKYIPLFQDNEIDEHAFRMLTIEDLKEMLPGKIGPQRNILRKVQTWAVSFSPPDYVMPTVSADASVGQLHGTSTSSPSEFPTHSDLTNQMDQLTLEIGKMSSRIDAGQNATVPRGFVYFQLHNEVPPNELWPDCQWEDISLDYDGLFFRACGASAEAFGTIQDENAPRVTQAAYTRLAGTSNWGAYSSPLPIGGWSDLVHTATAAKAQDYGYDTIKFETSGGDVRPRNAAMRIWRRV